MSLHAHAHPQCLEEPLVSVDHAWRVVRVNEAARALYRSLYGVELVNPEGRPLGDFVPDPAWTAIRRYGRRAVRQAAPLRFDGPLRTRDGAESWLEVHFLPSDEGLSLLCRDVTHLVRPLPLDIRTRGERAARADAEAARAECRQLQARLDAVLDSSLAGLGLVDRELRFQHVNEALARISHSSATALLGRTPRELPPALAATLEALLRQVIETGEPVVEEAASGPGAAPTERPGAWRVRCAPVRGPGGAVTGLAASVLNITPLKQAEAALRIQEQRWRASFHQSVIGMAQCDLSGRLLQANERFCEIVRRPAEAVLRRHAEDFIDREDRSEIRHLFDQVVAGSHGAAVEGRCTRPDGSRARVRITASRVDGAAGEPPSVTITVEEITERHQRQEELRLLMSNARCLLWSATVHETGHPLYLRWEQHFPIPDTAEQFIRLPLLPGESYKDGWYRCRLPEDRDRCNQIAAQAVRAGESYEQEFRVECADGTIRWVREDIRVETVLEGAQWRVIAVATDVTEQVRVRHALQVSRDREQGLRERLAALNRVSLALQQSETLDDLCRAAVEQGRSKLGFERLGVWLVGSEPETLHGTYGIDEHGRLRDERGLSFQVDAASTLRPVLSGEAVVSIREAVALRGPGGTVGTGTHMSAGLWNGERVLGVITADDLLSGGSFTAADRELLAAYASTVGHLYELKRTEAELRRRAEELAAADQRKDEFLAMLAHELRNPLAPITNAAALLAGGEQQDPAVQRQREIIQRQSNHMARLVDDLLDVSRITRGKVQLRVERVSVADLVRRASEVVAPQMRAGHHAFTISLPPEPLLFEADPTRLEQVLTNLLGNAAKYTEPGGRVELSASVIERAAGPHASGGDGVRGSHVMLEIRIRDTGIGIPPELLPHIFEPFTQAEQSLDRARGGLGIGLTLAKSLVEMHGGSIRAHSGGPGAGSEFVVILPVIRPAPGTAPEPDSDCSGLAMPGSPAIAGRKRRVLLVEDNVDAAETMEELLSAWGYETRVVHRGDMALGVASDFPGDIALLDIGLPGLDGYEVARRLRADPGWSGASLIAITGYGQSEDRRRAEQAGFNLHLTKPVDPEVLRGVLERLSTGL